MNSTHRLRPTRPAWVICVYLAAVASLFAGLVTLSALRSDAELADPPVDAALTDTHDAKATADFERVDLPVGLSTIEQSVDDMALIGASIATYARVSE